MADTDKKTTAAYVAWGTFRNAIEQLAQGLPNRLDRTVFTGMSWALQNQLFSALRFMGMTDQDNRPTKELVELVAGDEDQRKTKLREILQRQYADLFALDLKKTTPGELAQKMGESYAAVGETREKSVRFFTSAAEYVGIELSPALQYLEEDERDHHYETREASESKPPTVAARFSAIPSPTSGNIQDGPVAERRRFGPLG